MKKEFIGFYNPTKQEIDEAWNKGIFSFDANTLLNLYRYTDVTRKDFLSVLKALQKSLFIPHQSALEFHTNRIWVIEAIESSFSNLNKVFEINFEKNLESQIKQFKKHPSIKVDSIIKLHSEFLKKISEELERQKKSHPDFKTEDKVLNELTLLFANVIGTEFSKAELKKIFEEGKERYAELIPPGFKDLDIKRKKGERHIYGDLIIWKELINHTQKQNRPLIFVTDDRKEDWWTIENGKSIRPREELIKEFFDFTGIRLLIYNADQFLHFAKEKKLAPELKEATIKEVKDIRISDEKAYTPFQRLVNAGNLVFKESPLATDFYMPKELNFQDIYRPINLDDFIIKPIDFNSYYKIQPPPVVSQFTVDAFGKPQQFEIIPNMKNESSAKVLDNKSTNEQKKEEDTEDKK